MFKKNLNTDETISDDKQDKKIIRKKKRRKTLKFLLCLIIIWGVINTGITLIFSCMIPHHCASAKEGVDKMLSNTEYYDNLSPPLSFFIPNCSVLCYNKKWCADTV
ncbi:MAG: hypothetical protein IIT65_04985 [Lachnospiraceae bacterium]|nr:hypothetical protein [Lachnospiraceae bacterium]